MSKKLLICCRTPEELAALDLEDSQEQRRIQSNLAKEKTGYRCSDCGRFYPMLEVWYNGVQIDPKAISRPLGRRLKYKKASDVFRGDHYYATNKKDLLKFEIDVDGNAQQTDEIPLMGGVSGVAVSPDGRYIAAETFGGTVAVVDAQRKETILRRRNVDVSGGLHFVGNACLVYFLQDKGIVRWDFLEGLETLLWQVPEQWREFTDQKDALPVVCGAVVEAGEGRIVFQLGIGNRRFAVELQDLVPGRVFPLTVNWALPHLVYIPELQRFTFPTGDGVVVYDRDFRVVETFAYPALTKRLDGGGVFPIDEFVGGPPNRVFLSPDGAWVLFDFFNYILLMERQLGELRYCVYSHNGGASTNMGFLDERHIWYNWGNSTYIMEIT